MVELSGPYWKLHPLDLSAFQKQFKLPLPRIIFQGLAISLMAGGVASLLFSRMTVPSLYFLDKRWESVHRHQLPPQKHKQTPGAQPST